LPTGCVKHHREPLQCCYISHKQSHRNPSKNVWMDIEKAKGKVFCACLNWAPRDEGVLGEWSYSSTHSLASALDWGEWSASRPGRFIPKERASGTHWIGGWVGPRAGLDAVVKRKIPTTAGSRNRDHPARSPALYHWANPDHEWICAENIYTFI
jgi:hypothetical protein